MWSDAPLGSFSVRQSLETVPDYSRSIPRQTTALTNDPSESFPPSCFFGGPLSVWWRVGTLAAAAASPQAKPPVGVVAAPGCPPTPARDRGPSGELGGRPWLPVRVLAERCLGGPRRTFPRPKWAGNRTQITYAESRSCGPIFLKYENKIARLRAGFDRQAG